jgi:cell volume regulation protein A
MPLFARWLKLDAPPESKPPYPLELEPEAGLQSDLVNIGVPRNSPVAGRQIVEVGFPRGALIVLVGRGDSFIVAKGATVIQPDDRLLVLADKEDLAETRRILAA